MAASERSEGSSAPISIEELIALNDEIAALVRAGIPLERGLIVAGGDVRGRLGQIAAALGRRMSQGESLVEALESERRTIPRLYRAVVEAGARSGRLPIALEGLARFVRGYSEARAAIGMALWYPLIVLALAYTLFVLLVHNGLPHLAAAFDSLGLVTSSPLRRLIELGELAPYWWPIGPVLLLVLAFLWNRSGRAAQFQSGAWTGLRIFPWMRSTLADYETSNFAGLLGLLLEHKVPYPSALVLAAEATGEKKLIRGAAQMAAAIELGAPPTGALEGVDPESFQPMLRWTLATGQDQGSLAGSLQSLSEMYKKRATYRAEKMYVFLPLILMIGIGGAATLLYGLALFIPLVNLLYELGAA